MVKKIDPNDVTHLLVSTTCTSMLRGKTERGNHYYIVLTPPQAPQRHTEHLLFNPIIYPPRFIRRKLIQTQHSRRTVQSTFTFYKSVLDHARQVHVLTYLRRLWEPNTPKSDRLCFFFYRLLLFLSLMPIYAYARSTKQGAYVCIIPNVVILHADHDGAWKSSSSINGAGTTGSIPAA